MPENKSLPPTGTFNSSQEAAKKKARAERFNLPKSKQELAAEEREKAAALAAEVAEKKRQRGERFGTLSEEDKVRALAPAATSACIQYFHLPGFWRDIPRSRGSTTVLSRSPAATQELTSCVACQHCPV